jgi:hypothetical protein
MGQDESVEKRRKEKSAKPKGSTLLGWGISKVANFNYRFRLM